MERGGEGEEEWVGEEERAGFEERVEGEGFCLSFHSFFGSRFFL